MHKRFANYWQVLFLNQRKEKQKYAARPGIQPRPLTYESGVLPIALHGPALPPPPPPKKKNATEINKQSYGVNTCLETTCHGSNWSAASCSQIGIYTLFPPVHFNCVCCCQTRWLCPGTRCVKEVRNKHFREPLSVIHQEESGKTMQHNLNQGFFAIKYWMNLMQRWYLIMTWNESKLYIT